MKLLSPVIGSYVISQKFGGNANLFYAQNGLKGHPGTDIYKAYDAWLVASHDCYVYKIINKNNPDLSKYRAVHTLFQDDGQWYELVYGHCNNIYSKVGDFVPRGALLASMGNTGDVYSQGLPVTPAARTKPPYPGTHLHWQLRGVVLSQTALVGNIYLEDAGKPYQDKQGNYYEIPGYNDGYNGCIDAQPYLYNPSFAEQIAIYTKILLNIRSKVASSSN